jgi:hypothetical protein
MASTSINQKAEITSTKTTSYVVKRIVQGGIKVVIILLTIEGI